MRIELPFCSTGGFEVMLRTFSSASLRLRRRTRTVPTTRTVTESPRRTWIEPAPVLTSRSTAPETASVRSNDPSATDSLEHSGAPPSSNTRNPTCENGLIALSFPEWTRLFERKWPARGSGFKERIRGVWTRNGALGLPAFGRFHLLLHDSTVEEVDGALGVAGEARIVRHHADGGAGLVELLEQIHDRLAVA